MLKIHSKYFLAFLVILLFPIIAAAKDPIRSVEGTVIKVLSGDTIQVFEFKGSEIEIRLFGVDAPPMSKFKKSTESISNSRQIYGEEAFKALNAKISKQKIRLDIVGNDRFGKTLGIIWLNGTNINLAMISEGYVWSYWGHLDNTQASEYRQAEEQARAKKSGVWSNRGELPKAQINKVIDNRTKRFISKKQDHDLEGDRLIAEQDELSAQLIALRKAISVLPEIIDLNTAEIKCASDKSYKNELDNSLVKLYGNTSSRHSYDMNEASRDSLRQSFENGDYEKKLTCDIAAYVNSKNSKLTAKDEISSYVTSELLPIALQELTEKLACSEVNIERENFRYKLEVYYDEFKKFPADITELGINSNGGLQLKYNSKIVIENSRKRSKQLSFEKAEILTLEKNNGCNKTFIINNNNLRSKEAAIEDISRNRSLSSKSLTLDEIVLINNITAYVRYLFGTRFYDLVPIRIQPTLL